MTWNWRKILLAILALGVLVGGALLLARHERYEWSTDSPRALAAFEAGQEARAKLYVQEAIDHFEEALSHDPDFAAAKLFLIRLLARQSTAPERLDELIQSLRREDLEALNPRERALISIFQAQIEHRGDEAEQILKSYLEDRPHDPWLLELRCNRLVMAGNNEEADDCLRHLIDLDPNRVQAQNMLAYAAMNRGAFQEAEGRFEVYRFLAPDQPNPHDSLGELLLVTGRYDEAAAEFRQAVEMKSDFCPSWANLVNLALLRADGAAARERLGEVRSHQGCPPRELEALECKVAVWSAAFTGDWRRAWEAAQGCDVLDLETAAVAGRAAVTLAAAGGSVAGGDGPDGDFESLEALQERMLTAGRVAASRDMVEWVLGYHLEGLWHSAHGAPGEAVEPLREIADNLAWGGGLGIFRLLDSNELIAALAAAGRTAEAVERRRELAQVNRPFATAPPVPPLHPLPAVPPGR